MRDYDILRTHYNTLLDKKLSAEMASALELTPEAKRKRGGPTESLLLDALEASQKAVAESRSGRSDRRTKTARMLADKTNDAVRSLKSAEEATDSSDG